MAEAKRRGMKRNSTCAGFALLAKVSEEFSPSLSSKLRLRALLLALKAKLMKFKMKFFAFFSVLFRLVAWTRFGAIFISNGDGEIVLINFRSTSSDGIISEATQIQRESLTVMGKSFLAFLSANRNPFVALTKLAIVLRLARIGRQKVPRRSIKGNKISISRSSLGRRKYEKKVPPRATMEAEESFVALPCLAAQNVMCLQKKCAKSDVR
jgi:hypothetical protein